MKYLKQFVFLLFISLLPIKILFAQISSGIRLNYNWSYIGKNIDMSFQKSFKNNTVYAGFKYYLNIPFKDNQNNVTKNRYYSATFIEHFGLTAGYEYRINIKNSDLTPFIFYNFQFSDNRIYDYNIIMPFNFYNGKMLYKKYPDIYTNPMPVIDNNIGIGLKFKLYKRIYVSARAGIGIGLFYFDSSSPYSWGQSHWDWELTTFFNIGLIYYFK